MSLLRPRDIKNKKFKSGFSGYRKDDVEKFIKDVYLDYQELYIENLRLYEETDDLKIKVEDYTAKERMLEEAKVMANQVMDATNLCVKNKYAEAQENVRKMLDKAQTEAESILQDAYADGKGIIKQAEREAFEKADKIINDAKAEEEKIKAETDALVKKYYRMKKRIMMLIEAETKIMQQSDTYVFGEEDKKFE